MAEPMKVYLEVGAKRTFAGALDWPGWCRSGRDEPGALAALLAYGGRYAAAIGPGTGFVAPTSTAELGVVERLSGGAGTDFGVPGVAPSADSAPLEGPELARWLGLLEAAWQALDHAVTSAGEVPLRTGPRGGGRQVPKIVDHVREAEEGYLGALGRGREWPAGTQGLETRDLVRLCLAARSRGETPPPGRRKAPLWSPAAFIRREAWHVLDHAWEIEDRAP